MIFSTSSPTYPASVRVVASAMAKGTSRILARVRAKQSFAGTGRSDQQDVALFDFDLFQIPGTNASPVPVRLMVRSWRIRM